MGSSNNQLPVELTFLEAKNSRFPETCSWIAISQFFDFHFSQSACIHSTRYTLAFPLRFGLTGYFIPTLFFEVWQRDQVQENYRKGTIVSQLFSVLIAMINYLFVVSQ